MDLEDPNGVSERDIGLPILHPECWSDIDTQKCFSDCICLGGHWTQDGHAVPCDGFSMSRNHYLKNIDFRMTHLENNILESIDDEDSQEESYEDYILRKPNLILEKNDL